MQGELLKERMCGGIFRAKSRSCKPWDPCMGTLPMGCSGNNICFRAQHNTSVAGVTAVSKGLLTFTEVLWCWENEMGQDWEVRFPARVRLVFRHRGSDLLLVARENWFKFLISRGQQIQNWESHSAYCVFDWVLYLYFGSAIKLALAML